MFYLKVLLTSPDQRVEKVRVKADPKWTLSELERETFSLLVRHKVVNASSLPRAVALQSEAGEYMLSKDDLVGDWFAQGDAFRFAPQPIQGLLLFAQPPLAPSVSPVRHGVKRQAPVVEIGYSSGRKKGGAVARAADPVAADAVSAPASVERCSPPPQEEPLPELPPASAGAKRCKYCGKAREPDDHYRKKGGRGVLLCPDCFAKDLVNDQ